MKRKLRLAIIFLSLFPLEAVFASVKFKIEIQNYTNKALKFYCKTITGKQKWIFPKGNVIVPPKTSVTEDVEISRPNQIFQEEIQCGYSGHDMLNATAANEQGSPIKILEKTTDSIALDISFGGKLQLIVTPSLMHRTEMGETLDTRSEFLVSFENR